MNCINQNSQWQCHWTKTASEINHRCTFAWICCLRVIYGVWIFLIKKCSWILNHTEYLNRIKIIGKNISVVRIFYWYLDYYFWCLQCFITHLSDNSWISCTFFGVFVTKRICISITDYLLLYTKWYLLRDDIILVWFHGFEVIEIYCELNSWYHISKFDTSYTVI